MVPDMANRTARRASLLLALLLACGGSGGGDAKPEAEAAGPPPAAPSTGAPIVFEATKLTPGEKLDGKIAVKAYNFSDKSIAGYTMSARYKDKDGKVLKVSPGTPFEADFAWTSMQGKKFLCKPKSWCSFDISMEVPPGATEAQVVLTSAQALKDDGMTFEEEDVWKSKDGFGNWPSDVK
jgi:hypothetical protein